MTSAVGLEGKDRKTSILCPLKDTLSTFTFLTPLWTIVVAVMATWNAQDFSNILGSLPVMQKAYVSLMFVMGLTITPKDIKRTVTQPSLLSINALLCFGLMPLLARGIAEALSFSSSQNVGLVLLGCVSGGQASNLFTLIAGGDVALSVICTISTTLLGVLFTPVLVKNLLGCSIHVDGRGILESIVSMVFAPLLGGWGLAQCFPKTITRVQPFLPTLGVLSTLVLVAGGSANTAVQASTLTLSSCKALLPNGWQWAMAVVLPSILLSCLGGALAWCVTKKLGLQEETQCALVIETLSKSPTLAYVLAKKHFDVMAAQIPGAAMVTLAVVGALIASAWSTVGKKE